MNRVIKLAYFHLRRIAAIRKYITHEACAKVIHATVTSKLDFHNGLLVDIPEKSIRRLQVVQNNAARLLMRVRKTEQCITPILNDLHWLPINKRISYKILTMVQNALHSPVAPGYLREQVIVYRPARPLRSATNHWTLVIPRSRQKHGDSSFSVAGPKLWNTLPVELRVPQTSVVFKKKLKTFLFRS